MAVSISSASSRISAGALSTSALSSASVFSPTVGRGELTFDPGRITVPPISVLPFIPPVVFTPPTAPAQQPAAQPASPTATASDLQVLIASVPIAQDGHVISAEYHNALRNALVAIANHLGLGTVSEEITVTNAPRFVRESDTPEWDHQYG